MIREVRVRFSKDAGVILPPRSGTDSPAALTHQLYSSPLCCSPM